MSKNDVIHKFYLSLTKEWDVTLKGAIDLEYYDLKQSGEKLSSIINNILEDQNLAEKLMSEIKKRKDS
jgi:hypothetical protein